MASQASFTGNRLRRIREGRKLTKSALAQKSGIVSGVIEQIETGEIDPTIGQLQCIAEAMDIMLAELLVMPPAPIDCRVQINGSFENAAQAVDALIPVPIVTGSVAAGNARIVDESVLGWIFLPKDEFGLRSGNLIAVQVYGRSMEPELPDGCIAVVDRNDRVITPESIFAVRDPDGGCTVKRIEVLDASYLALVPSNRREFKVEFWKLEPGESISDRIIGRVVWAGFSFLNAQEAAERSPLYGRQDIGLAKDLPRPPRKPNEPF